MEFTKAIKHEAKLRMALIGPAGSGKTMTALKIAGCLGKRIALLDSEHGSATKYADLFDFDSLEPESFSPQTYIDAIAAAEAAGYDVLILDSLSHAWTGKEGALELVDRAAKRSQSGNTFAAWRDVTPLHNRMIDAILAARLHIIATMRTKTEYVMEQNEKGKTVPRKIGLQPVQRDGLEYEFDVVADLDQDNNLIVGKTRCSALHGKVFAKAGQDVAQVLSPWLSGVKRDETKAPLVEPTRVPAQPTAGSVDGKAPSSPKQLLAYVNQRVAVKYENASIEGALAHLFNAIRKELGPEWNWPGSKDEAGWQRAAEAAIKHAQDKAPALERADVVKRLETLVTEYQAIGQGLNWDPAWLREAPVEDLIEQGKAKRAQLDALKAKQPAMPGMEGQA